MDQKSNNNTNCDYDNNYDYYHDYDDDNDTSKILTRMTIISNRKSRYLLCQYNIYCVKVAIIHYV